VRRAAATLGLCDRMLAALEQALRAVPLLESFGVRAEDLRPGALVLRLPYGPHITNHAGAIHNGAIFAVGELAAAVVLATHPELGRFRQFQKSSRIKYFVPSHRDVTAHAEVPPEVVAAAQEGAERGGVVVDVPVKVLDGHGADIAELVCRFMVKGG
jgi:acyl-coenzyme A thioesterase PaaI-like protein